MNASFLSNDIVDGWHGLRELTINLTFGVNICVSV